MKRKQYNEDIKQLINNIENINNTNVHRFNTSDKKIHACLNKGKYYIVDKNYLNTDDSHNGSMYEGASPFIAKQTYDVNVPFGYTKLDTNYTNFDIYENTNHIELGFAYDTYTYLDHAYYESSYYETLYSKMAIIDKENEDLYLDNYEEVVTNKLTNFNK